MRSGPAHEHWLHFFIQLERWRVLLLRRVCGERSVHPMHARGTVGAGLVGRPCRTSSTLAGERFWSKPWRHQQPEPAILAVP